MKLSPYLAIIVPTLSDNSGPDRSMLAHPKTDAMLATNLLAICGSLLMIFAFMFLIVMIVVFALRENTKAKSKPKAKQKFDRHHYIVNVLTWGALPLYLSISLILTSHLVGFLTGNNGGGPLVRPDGSIENILSKYPEPKGNFKKYVFNLPQIENEENSKVEIIVKKTMMADCNSRSFNGTLEEYYVEGYRLPYYEMNNYEGPISTKKGCIGYESKPAFVTVSGDGFVQKYDSKRPLVVYVPNDFEVDYKLWEPIHPEN